MINIPLHQDPQLTTGAMAVMRGTYLRQLTDRAVLAFTMMNLAHNAGHKSMRRYPSNAVFGSFRSEFVQERVLAAYPKQDKAPPPLTAKQLAKAEAHERYRERVIADQQVSLNNYEHSQWYGRSRRLDEKSKFIGCRNA